MPELIFIIEDKKSMAEMLARTVEAEGYRALTATSGEEGVQKALKEKADLVLTDLKLPAMSGLDVLKKLKERRPFLPVIMMTAFGSIETAVEAVKAGAYDFLTKPFETSHLLVLIEKALESGRLSAENLALKSEFSESLGMPKLIGESPAFLNTLELIKKAAPTKATVLITGESGTGKELFARALHYLSPRAKGAFIALNCAAIPKDLLESELFGHEKGAFTGAEARRIGKFELADKGTIFLDEVGEMDISLQAKLLRVLQGESIERVGGSEPLAVDVRVVAASNRDLRKAVEDGRLREDLYYRLNVFPVHIPPLRERMEDVPLLAAAFKDKYCAELKKCPLELSGEAMDALVSRPWKGNVRELENCIERAVIIADGMVLPEHVGGADLTAGSAGAEGGGGLAAVAERAARAAEVQAIRKALEKCQGNKTKAAELLSVSYKTLLTKIKDYGIG